MRGYDNAGFTYADSRGVAWGVVDDHDIAMRVQYIGAQDSGTVEVNAGGEILFKHGVTGAEGADTNVSTDGTIATGGALENTVGEVVDIINATTNWRAVHIDALREYHLVDTLLDSGPSQAKIKGGLALCFDSSVKLWISRLVAPEEIRQNIEVFYDSDGNVDYDLPFKGTRSAVNYMSGAVTFASGTAWFFVYSETSSGDALGAALQTQQLYVDVIDVTQTEQCAAGLDGSGFELIGEYGERVVAAIGSQAGTAFTFRGNGRMFRAVS